MTKFIKSIVNCVDYKGQKFNNNPINIDLVTEVSKRRLKYYPDNEGIPSIYFKGVDVEWVYLKDSDRDSEFETIINADYGR